MSNHLDSNRLDYAAAAPGGMKALADVHGYLGKGTLPPSLINLVYLRVSQMNGCAYCIGKHSHDLLAQGLPVDKLVLVPVWAEAPTLFTAQEQAALRWAETVTRVADTTVPDAEFAAVRQHFNDRDLADLTIAIGLMNAYNRLAISFRTTPDAARG